MLKERIFCSNNTPEIHIFNFCRHQKLLLVAKQLQDSTLFIFENNCEDIDITTINWCILIVYTLINGIIQGIASIISSSFFIIFYIEWIYASSYRFRGCFSESIKLDPDPGLRVWINVSYENVPRWINEVFDHLKTYETCIEAVEKNPHSLAFVLDHFKTQEMWNEAVRREPHSLAFIPDHLRT